jgi:hypothetical protein
MFNQSSTIQRAVGTKASQIHLAPFLAVLLPWVGLECVVFEGCGEVKLIINCTYHGRPDPEWLRNKAEGNYRGFQKSLSRENNGIFQAQTAVGTSDGRKLEGSHPCRSTSSQGHTPTRSGRSIIMHYASSKARVTSPKSGISHESPEV